MRIGNKSLVTTIKDKCRMCYSCIRECPAKAIQVVDAQASVIGERCIGCGICFRVCAKRAKRVLSSVHEVVELLRNSTPTVAIVAPSFPAEFSDMSSEVFVGALKQLGFAEVLEVAFGADLVAQKYAQMLDKSDERYIGSTCPAMVGFVTKYFPVLTENLMPVVSPMIAAARVAKIKFGDNTRIVFIGPCLAKKAESHDEFVGGEVDAVLTYSELRELFVLKNLDFTSITPEDFAEPRGSLGGLFAVSRGLLQAAGLNEDLLLGNIVVAEGQQNFSDAMDEFLKGTGDVRLLEILCCNGCISGVGFTNEEPMLVRRLYVSQYVRQRMLSFDQNRHQENLKTYADILLDRRFNADDQRIDLPSEENLQEILKKLEKNTLDDELNCGACGYPTCRSYATAVYRGLAEPEMCLPYTVESLKKTVVNLESTNNDLLLTKEALVRTEKLASMGQLAAGIAHEVNNPLGIVLLYANLLLEQCENSNKSKEDLTIILDQANRCKKIVMGLLNFARQNKLYRVRTDAWKLVNRVIKSVKTPSNVTINIRNHCANVSTNLDPDQITQVLCNLIENSFAAMANGGEVEIVLEEDDRENVLFKIIDTGSGIPAEHLSRIFEPFYTTKPVGKGTGLGLAVVHGIVKMHGGNIQVVTNNDPNKGATGSIFVVSLPRMLENFVN